MDSLEQNAITQLLNLEDKEIQNGWDINTPIQIHKSRSLVQLRQKKILQPIEQRKRIDVNHECHFQKFPKIYQQEHSFKSLMEEYFKQLNQRQLNLKKDVQKSTRLRHSSYLIEESAIRKSKHSCHEILLQDNQSNKQIKLSDLCKDIMIYKPLKKSSYFPRLEPSYHLK
ncbi:unnamed protein product (macronuclear) [Paramecium tetraurelia]|uniref:Uncharacterized protein n=1 Tax=Paramecium tetraurelia TaxID=5888 RepID=A0D9X9_PARTE|nr:uncharacterized protein GSPATT00014778001 [Paramecium tetraurelia]CAK79846.1 unnamed protein product [Paramecium tetraurelia]|eukprot:XP_001447243.1 hypothetical protein (macronuclear) [Paramecium tetraurelia strain d4-2]